MHNERLTKIHNYSLNQNNFIKIQNIFVEQYKILAICFSVDLKYI